MKPERGQSVTLELVGRDPLPATAYASEGSVVSIVLPVGPERGALPAMPGSVQFASRRGVHRLHGMVHPDEARGELLYLRCETDDTVQRRDWVRVDAVLPVVMTDMSGSTPRRASTTTLNVSAGGLLIVDPLELQVDAMLQVELDLDSGGPRLPSVARVARAVSPTEKGVRFDVISERDRDRLVRYVTERQRLELQRIRRGA